MKQATNTTNPTIVKGIGKEEVDVNVLYNSSQAFSYSVMQVPSDNTYPSGHVAQHAPFKYINGEKQEVHCPLELQVEQF